MDTAAIERLKQQWTGRKVETAGASPTLRRFAGRMGTVMTVNMNGRALVQFEGDVDVAWYDLDFADLKAAEPSSHERKIVARHLGKHAPPEAKSVAHEPPPPVEPTSPATPDSSTPKRPSTAEIMQRARKQGAFKST